jgi:hypothetical protein
MPIVPGITGVSRGIEAVTVQHQNRLERVSEQTYFIKVPAAIGRL